MERNEENEMLKLSEIDVNKCFIQYKGRILLPL